MPTPILTLDAVEDAEIEIDNRRLRIMRTGWVKPLDTSKPKVEILASALSATGWPATNSPFPSSDPALQLAVLRRILIRPVRGVNKARVHLGYEMPETGGGAGPGLVFILERRTTLVTEETQFHPDGTPLNIQFENPNDPNGKITQDIATMQIMSPWQQLTATGYYGGEPPEAMVTAIGSVNSTDWHGFGPGFWMYVGETTRTQDWGDSYHIQLAFLTRVRRDWSSYAAMKDPQTGKFMRVNTGHKQVLQDKPYEYKVDNELPVGTANGIVKAGLYPLVNFSTLFGF